MSQPPRKHLARVRMLSRPGRAAPGLRITHVKSIKPPDPEASKKQEEERLRAQLQKEIVSRSRQCAYKDYECLLPVMSGRHYCGRHILKDPTAPYKQCVHTFGNGERCSQPAPDNKDHRERDLGLCFEHARASLHARQRAAAPPPPATTTETLLNQLQHYVRPERPRTTSCASSVSVVSDHDPQDPAIPSAVDPFRQIVPGPLPLQAKLSPLTQKLKGPVRPRTTSCASSVSVAKLSPLTQKQKGPERPRTTSCASSVSVVSDHDPQDPAIPSAEDPFSEAERPRTTSCALSVSVVSDHDPQDPAIPSAVDPFKQIDATAVNAQYSASIMECASASDSDCDSVTLGPDGTIRECDSDSDEAPCETQPLWRAGVYTAEEAVSEARSALVSLQQAYTRQLSRLRVILQTHRGNYLRALKAEKETYCSINAQARSGPLTVRERRQLRKLKAYAAHHRRHGVDAVLARKLTHKRAKQGTEPSNRPIPSQSRCTYTEESVRCGNPVLPASKHCLKHILHDSNQVLFVPCSSARGVGACREAVPLLPAAPLCRYHAPVPAHQVFHMRKDESKDGSESEVTSDASEPGPSEPVLSEPILSEIPARSAITSAALQDIMFQ
ncbi:KAT8 regulatory NSL complex subunit 2 [Ostrinia nubilalis]|uniref:KAT8 regulatory NSL complex subunit 2 n=1 Tax=Ostrinia nubilalis TaxID=29057 RepID=UPI0030826138